MTEHNEQTDNVINLPLSGLWFVLDDQLRPRPLPNRNDLGFPDVSDMEKAFEYRWGYQSKVGGTILSSTFLALNHCSWLATRSSLQLFELAAMTDEGVDILGRFGDIDECIEAHHEALKELVRFSKAANE